MTNVANSGGWDGRDLLAILVTRSTKILIDLVANLVWQACGVLQTRGIALQCLRVYV